MKFSSLKALAAFGLLSPCVLAQDGTSTVLTKIREAFAAIDADRNGEIDLAEATKQRVATRDFTAQDVDNSASLNASEFLVYYRQLLVTAGRKVPADLDAEIQRVEAERRKQLESERVAAAKRQAEEQAQAAAKAEEERVAQARQREQEAAAAAARAALEPAPATSGGAPEKGAQPKGSGEVQVQRATFLVEQLVTAGALSTEEGRDMLRGLDDLVPAAGDARALEGIREAVLRAQPRVLGLVQGGQLTAEQGRILSEALLARATAAGSALTSLSEGGTAGEGAREPAKSGEAETAAAEPVAAQQMLERLAESGRLTRQEADAMAVALQDPAAFAGDSVKLGRLRGAVNRIRPRLGSMVQQGKLTADEARALSAALQARGQQAAQALGALGAPGARQAQQPAEADKPAADAAPAAETTPRQGPVAGGRPGRPEVEGAQQEARPDAGGATGAMAPREAQKVLGRLIADGSVSAEDGSAWLAALGEHEGASAAQLRQVRDALAAARPRIAALVQEGKLSTEEGRGLATWINRRGKQVGQSLTKQSGQPSAKQPARRDPGQEPAAGEEPGRRAQAYVRRLIAEGRVSAVEGRIMYQAMTDPSTIAGDATQLEGLRAALEKTRPRVGELVRQGHLTVEEGRELSTVFDARATAAASALKALDAKAKQREEKAKESEAPPAERGAGREAAGRQRKGRPEAGAARRRDG